MSIHEQNQPDYDYSERVINWIWIPDLPIMQ